MAAELILLMNLFDTDTSSEDEAEPQEKKRRIWVREYYKSREIDGSFKTQFLKQMQDPFLFNQFCRMDPESFEELHFFVQPLIKKQTCLREPISSECRLAITLRYLATGESQKSLGLSFKCSPSVVHNIVLETTSAIVSVLKEKVFPKITIETFLEISEGFDKTWQFPHCIGALDGKHVKIQAPPCSGSKFFNYKKTFSIVLMAASDAHYRFIMCEVGGAGSESDNGVFSASSFGKQFYNNKLPIPSPSSLTEKFTNVPYVLVADDAFPLETNLMKPFSHSTLDTKEQIFNYRLSRARRVIENAFGILAGRWRILQNAINADLKTTESIVMSSVCLHNWLRSKKCRAYKQDTKSVLNVNFFEEQIPSLSHSSKAKEIRNKFMEFFAGEGSVPWQWDKI